MKTDERVYFPTRDKPTEQLFWDNGFRFAEDLKDADLVVFVGGTDINPKLYGESPLLETDSPDVMRDALEEGVFHRAYDKKIPMVGICRGAQLLCALNGGKLKQHDDTGFHLFSHEITVSTDTNYLGSSWKHMIASANHHQIMIPSLENSNVIGRTIPDSVWFEFSPEIVYWEDTKSLGHQPHPEWMSQDSPYVKYFFKTIDDLLLK